jgi:hypothetical protein
MEKSLSGLAATLVDRLFAGNAIVGVVALTLAAAIAAAMVVSKGWYFWRERSLLLTTRRQDLLLGILKSEDLSRVSPARLQIAFARAYGFWLPSVELRFALVRENSHELVWAMRLGRRFATFQPTIGEFVQKGRGSLAVKEHVAGFTAVLSLLAMFFSATYAWLANQPAVFLVSAELAVLAWICLEGSAAASRARQLLDLSRFPAFLTSPRSEAAQPAAGSSKPSKTSRRRTRVDGPPLLAEGTGLN